MTSPVVLAEIELGIRLRPFDRRRAELEHWFHHELPVIPVLPFDRHVAHAWARMYEWLRPLGINLPRLDGIIAATALAHGLTVATRNTADFRPCGVDLVDPFEGE